tara:strand:+ start:413 stop:799 length:387 start_codon:yes stop_codon:yes gene_type:complete
MQYQKNPLTPHLQIYRWQISSLLSIAHRIIGVINIFAIILICLWIISLNFLESNYDLIHSMLNSSIGKFLTISISWTFSFHILNEIRHLVWDFGYGFNLRTSKITGVLTIIFSFVLTVIIYLFGTGLN